MPIFLLKIIITQLVSYGLKILAENVAEKLKEKKDE